MVLISTQHIDPNVFPHRPQFWRRCLRFPIVSPLSWPSSTKLLPGQPNYTRRKEREQEEEEEEEEKERKGQWEEEEQRRSSYRLPIFHSLTDLS